jgi:DNA helicase-2/ATP-dependent DNA helicase PcrA
MMDKTVAILARTNRALVPFEQLLSEKNIPFRYINKSGFFSQPEIRTVLAYLQCCLYPSDYAVMSALRAPFYVTKYLPKVKIAARVKELQTDGEPSAWHLLTKETYSLVENKNLSALTDFIHFIHSLSRYKDLKAAEAAKQVLVALKAVDHYSEFEDTPDNDPQANLAELVKVAGRFSGIKDLLDYARRVAAASKSKKGVMLSTVHSFKGMEADTVYFAQCSEEIIPHAKSTDLDEERNCFFVGASRAERELILTYSGRPSIFLESYAKGIEEPLEIQYIRSLHSTGVPPADAVTWIHKCRQEEGR